MTPNELLTKNDLLLFKSDLIEEFRKFIDQGPVPKESTYLKSKDVKKMLKCSDSTLQYYRQSGKLPFNKVGGIYYYTKEGISQLMNS